MDLQDIIADAGKAVADSVSQAINSGNFSDLSRNIKNSVNDARERVRMNTSANPYSSTYRRSFTPPPNSGPNWRPYGQQGQPYGAGQGQTGPQGQPYSGPQGRPYGQQGQTYSQQAYTPKGQTAYRPDVIKPSNAGNIFLMVVGAAGGIFSLSQLLTNLFGMFPFPTFGHTFGAIFFGVLTGLCGWLFLHNAKKTGLISRIKQYIDTIGNREYIELKELSERTGTPLKTVKKDMRKLLKRSDYPYARLDRQETTLMLSDRAFKSYEAADSSYRKRAASEEEERRREDSIDSDVTDPEVRKILKEGRDYIKTIREINDEIPDVEDMSTKLYDLEDIMKRIFEQVKERPENASGIRKLMNYYLPTTVKLLKAYASFDRQPGGGENIEKSKREIEESMDTINAAFLKFLDSMFEYQYYDVSSDINVMKKMMSRDGIAPEMVKEGDSSNG